MPDASEFGRLYDSACALERGGFARGAALATITRTAGSTFRHAGASMLVHGDGTVVCELSGGCPQRDIVERAQRVIASGAAELARYNRDSSFDVLLEMGCGGELEVLIEPLREPRDLGFLHALAQLHAQRQPGYVATAFARAGEVLTRPQRQVGAAQALWDELPSPQLSQRAAALASAQAAGAVVHPVEDGIELLVERVQAQQLLVLVGINAVALALANLAATLGWKSILVHNGNLRGTVELPARATLLDAAPQALAERLASQARCAVVLMTFNLQQDLAYLEQLAPLPLEYLAAIGSRARSTRLHAAVAASGARLLAPAGLDLGAEGPYEIALAIAAEILARQRERGAGSLSSHHA